MGKLTSSIYSHTRYYLLWLTTYLPTTWLNTWCMVIQCDIVIMLLHSWTSSNSVVTDTKFPIVFRIGQQKLLIRGKFTVLSFVRCIPISFRQKAQLGKRVTSFFVGFHKKMVKMIFKCTFLVKKRVRKACKAWRKVISWRHHERIDSRLGEAIG